VNGGNKTDPVLLCEVEIAAQTWIPNRALMHISTLIGRLFYFQEQNLITLITIFVNAGGLSKSPNSPNLQPIETPH